MKKLFTLLFLLSLGNLSLWAEGRSEQEASAIACSFLQKKAHSRGASTNQEASLTLVYTAKDENGNTATCKLTVNPGRNGETGEDENLKWIIPLAIIVGVFIIAGVVVTIVLVSKRKKK